MKSKIIAARMATLSGIGVIVASGKNFSILQEIGEGKRRGTFFWPEEKRLPGRKRWIAFAMIPRGSVVIDEGAKEALLAQKSLLPAGVKGVEGNFDLGDCVEILGPSGELVGRGITNYSSEELQKILGLHTEEVREVLGGKDFDEEVVHADNLVLLGESDMRENVKDMARKTKQASYFLANVSSFHKNQFLLQLADNLERYEEEIKKENRRDLGRAKDMGMQSSLLDRLELSSSRIQAMASGLREVANLPDPVGEVIEGCKRPNGLLITKVRVPLGVVAIIYEARPNVTIDSVALGIKSGNALLLRGSSSAVHSNRVLIDKTKQALSQCGFPPEAVNLLRCESHEEVQELLTLRDYVDVVIPRGGAGLIKSVVEKLSNSGNRNGSGKLSYLCRWKR